jgi:hypothetical protein
MIILLCLQQTKAQMSSTKQKLLAGIFSLFCCHTNAANIAGLSGTYVCLTNKNFAPFAANLIGSTGVASNNLSLINMDTMQLSSISSTTSNWGKTTPSPLQSNLVSTGSFKISSGLIAGSYIVTSEMTTTIGGKVINFTVLTNLIPANSGNTLFTSTASNSDASKEPETGVCQKQ